MQPTGIGIIGCGNISSIYCKNLALYNNLRLVEIADLDVERARARAEEFSIPKFGTVDSLLNNPEVELVLNITIPKAHFDVSRSCLDAGKHVYVEKPLCVTRADGAELVRFANAKGLRVGCAPDTFLGGGIQTCLKLINDGWIGRPVAATAFMMSHGPESWHPHPEFYYEKGGGPMLDMGPYYLTALIALLGPIAGVSGTTSAAQSERIATSQTRMGTRIPVKVPTHVAGLLEFGNGAVATLVTSFDVWSSEVPRIEIYGTEGTLSVPDPNSFGGPVRLRRMGTTVFSEMPLTHGYAENSRGVGLADMASAIQSDRPHRANGDLAYHVLDVMEGIHDSAKTGQRYIPASTTIQLRPMPMVLLPNTVE